MIASRLLFHPIFRYQMDATITGTTRTIVMVIARSIMIMSMDGRLRFMTVMMPALHIAPMGMGKVVESKEACAEEMIVSW